MKATFSLVALAAGAAATKWTDSSAFKCPSNTNNQCDADQSSGYDFGDLASGGFSSYKGMNWNKWTCDGSAGKRFAPRTGGKSISGSCGHDKASSPSFGCGASTPDFSVSSYHVKPEFDCDLEFHYDMPDGSTCKHRNACSKSGTTVTNSQCGGAKNVTIVYPSGQPKQSKSSCSVTVSTISFDCSTAHTTVPVKTTSVKTTSAKTTHTSPAETSPVKTTAKTTTQNSPAETSSVTTSKPAKPTESVDTTKPAETTKPGKPTESVESKTTKPAVSSPGPFENSTSVATATSTKPAVTSPVTTTWVTSFDSTSTIFTTSVQTITSCAPTVPNCPAESQTHVTQVTVTIPKSTTICPVTETRTTVLASQPAESSPAGPKHSTTPVAAESGSAVVTSSSPAETLPCPDVVPKCLNTFIWSIGCKDNSDASCFCVEAAYINNVYDCMFAHGESDQVISEAVQYMMGLCAGFAGHNPAVATGATITSYLTVTATSVASVYTTVSVHTTAVVPCTDSAGAPIPSSSTTVTVDTSVVVPQVGLTTGANGAEGVIPVTAISTADAGPTGAGAGAAPYPTGASTSAVSPAGQSVGTVGVSASSPTGTGIVVSGAGRLGAGVGAALAVMAVVAAL